MKHLRIIAAAAMLWPVAGCGSAASPDNVTVALTMGETVQSLRQFTSTTSGQTVTVLGAFATPDPCYNFTASVTHDGDTFEAIVKADSKGGACVTLFNRQNYTLLFAGVPPGTWTVRVMHREDGKTPLLQYETEVTIR
jgi:hypothetical protein